MRILILEMGESEESILQDIFSLLSGKVKFQFMELSGSAEPCKNLETSILTVSDLEIHVREQTVYKAGVLIPMSHYEFFTLCYLAKHPGWVFTKRQIYEAVWQEADGDSDAAVTNVISQIRKKLNPDDPTHGCIRTVVSKGIARGPPDNG